MSDATDYQPPSVWEWDIRGKWWCIFPRLITHLLDWTKKIDANTAGATHERQKVLRQL